MVDALLTTMRHGLSTPWSMPLCLGDALSCEAKIGSEAAIEAKIGSEATTSCGLKQVEATGWVEASTGGKLSEFECWGQRCFSTGREQHLGP